MVKTTPTHVLCFITQRLNQLLYVYYCCVLKQLQHEHNPHLYRDKLLLLDPELGMLDELQWEADAASLSLCSDDNAVSAEFTLWNVGSNSH